MKNRKYMKKPTSEDASIKSFLDMIAPSVVSFMPDHFICGNTYLGKFCRNDLSNMRDHEKAEQWFQLSTEAGNDFSEYAPGPTAPAATYRQGRPGSSGGQCAVCSDGPPTSRAALP